MLRASCVLDEAGREGKSPYPSIPEVAAALGLGAANRRLSRGHRLRFGRQGSLAVDTATGSWFSHEAGRGGGAVELVEFVRGCDWRAARDWLAEQGFGGRPDMPRRARKPALHAVQPEVSPEPDADALRLWANGRDPAGTLAERYLARRGLSLWDGAADVIRFHSRGPWDGGPVPMLLTLAVNVLTGLPQAVQRTGLNPDGSKIGRRFTGSAKGAVAMLTPDDRVEAGLSLCEGTEDAIAVIQSGGWLPVWATFGTSGLSAFPLLPGIERLVIYADDDEPGRAAAGVCADRWAEAGRMVEQQFPPMKDFGATKEAAHA